MRVSLEDIFVSLMTEEKAGRRTRPRNRRWPMRNVMAIAERELRGVLRVADRATSLIGFFSLLFGYFFYALLSYLRAAEHADGHGRSPGRR